MLRTPTAEMPRALRPKAPNRRDRVLARLPNAGPGRWIALWLLLTLHGQCLAADTLTLSVSPKSSTDGVVALTWQTPGDQAARLQQSLSDDFRDPRVIYEGTDTGTTLTGLEDGRYFFRVGTRRDAAQPWAWSESVELTVAHHSLGRAFSFFAVGVVVFVSTLVLIVTGARRHGPGSR